MPQPLLPTFPRQYSFFYRHSCRSALAMPRCFEGSSHFLRSVYYETVNLVVIRVLRTVSATLSSLLVFSPKSLDPFVHYRPRTASLERISHELENSKTEICIPDSLSKLSILPNLFSRPSIYFALVQSQGQTLASRWSAYPFGGFLFFSTCVNTHSVL